MGGLIGQDLPVDTVNAHLQLVRFDHMHKDLLDQLEAH
jgi:hypothetical protein